MKRCEGHHKAVTVRAKSQSPGRDHAALGPGRARVSSSFPVLPCLPSSPPSPLFPFLPVLLAVSLPPLSSSFPSSPASNSISSPTQIHLKSNTEMTGVSRRHGFMLLVISMLRGKDTPTARCGSRRPHPTTDQLRDTPSSRSVSPGVWSTHHSHLHFCHQLPLFYTLEKLI